MSRTILVVEDDADAAATLTSLLRHDGHDVYAAKSVDQALHIAEKQPIDLVLFDIDLPDGDGRNLFHRIKHEHQDVQGIAVTGHEFEDEKLPEVPLVPKPYRFSRIQRVIETLGEGSKQGPPSKSHRGKVGVVSQFIRRWAGTA